MKVFKSMDDYKSPAYYNYYCIVKVLGGRIVSVTTDFGREGGEIWNIKWPHQYNGPLKGIMKDIKRRWPITYHRIIKEIKL